MKCKTPRGVAHKAVYGDSYTNYIRMGIRRDRKTRKMISDIKYISASIAMWAVFIYMLMALLERTSVLPIETTVLTAIALVFNTYCIWLVLGDRLFPSPARAMFDVALSWCLSAASMLAGAMLLL